MALTGVAAAATSTITMAPLKDVSNTNGTWSDKTVVDSTNNAFISPENGWGGDVYTYTFNTPIELNNAKDTFIFSYDIGNTDTGNFVLTLSFIGTDENGTNVVLSSGKGGFSDLPQGTNAAYGEIGEGITGFAFKESSAQGDHIHHFGSAGNISGSLPTNATTSLTGTVAWNATAQKFQLNFLGKTVDMGTSFTATDMVITTIADEGTSGTLSNISLKATTVPEPTTATLSLLALVGLAARRRRASR